VTLSGLPPPAAPSKRALKPPKRPFKQRRAGELDPTLLMRRWPLIWSYHLPD
jgi:hypothetical protein